MTQITQEMDEIDNKQAFSYINIGQNMNDFDNWIQSLLNPDVLFKNYNQYEGDQVLNECITSETSQNLPQQHLQIINPCGNSKESLFHNFQKHLLNILRRLIKLNKTKIQRQPYGRIAYQLWRSFVKSKINSKKILLMLFGAQDNATYELSQIAQQIQTLLKIMQKHPATVIQEAQKLLRLQVVKKLKLYTKIQVQSKCRIIKFEQFYEYFQDFITGLESGSISRRMTKQRKNQIYYKIMDLQSLSINI